MLKIKDFSKMSSISIRMLRFYDEKGILKPALIKENGYRFYEPKQILLASYIRYLSYLGFSLDKIKHILSVYQNGHDIVQYLKVQLEELKDEQIKMKDKIEALNKTIEKINQEEIMMNYQVEVKEIPAKMMMCKRSIIPSYDKESLLWQGLNAELMAYNMEVKTPEEGVSMAVFYDDGYKDSEVDVEIRVEVKGQYKDTENIKFRMCEPVKVASVIFNGGYEHITEVCYHIASWISEHNLEVTGPNFSIYHVGYGQTQNPEEFVTEICYPI